MTITRTRTMTITRTRTRTRTRILFVIRLKEEVLTCKYDNKYSKLFSFNKVEFKIFSILNIY